MSFGLSIITQFANFDGLEIDSNGDIIISGNHQKNNQKEVILVKILNSFSISLDDKTESNILSIYPNPIEDFATLFLNLKTQSPIILSLVDQGGKTIRSWSPNPSMKVGENKIELDMTGVSPGLYVLRIESQEGYEAIRLVVD